MPTSLRRPSPRLTNLTLLAALAVVLATGVGAFTVGTAEHRWVVVAHGVGGLLVVLLTPWKGRVVRGGLSRRRPSRWLSLALAVLVVLAVLSGVLHSTGLLTAAGGQLMLWWHVAAGLAMLPLLAWHVVAHRQRARRADLDRRLVLRSGLLVGAAGGLWLATETMVRLTGLPGAGRRFTGSYWQDRPQPTIWLDDTRPSFDPASWRLTVRDATGAREVDLAQIRVAGAQVRAVIDCTSGWCSDQLWTGVPVTSLLRETGEARSVVIRSSTGYQRRFSLRELDGLFLAHAMAGEDLPPELGAPVRLVAPGRRGLWWVKWVDRVEVSDLPHWWQPTFPLT